jgi:hypothetical protein
MKNIIIFVLLLLVYSCGASRKITESDSHTKVNIESVYTDTSKIVSSWEIVLNTVLTEIDLSNIWVTTYYPQKDSNGNQLIKEEIIINNNKTVVKTKSTTEVKNVQESSGIKLDNSIQIQEDIKIKTVEIKPASPWRTYLILLIILIILIIALVIIIKLGGPIKLLTKVNSLARYLK